MNLEIAKLDEIRGNISLKTDEIYNSIENLFSKETDNSLISDYRISALNIKQRTDEMIDFIQSIKIEIIKAVEGENSPAINGFEINSAKMVKTKNTKVPFEILIGKNEDGKAYYIKALSQDYKAFLIETVRNDSLITKSINDILNTDDQKNKNSETETWEKYTFQGQSMGSVIIELTQLQNNVKSAELEVLSFVQNEMNEKSKLNN
ncbi:MAG: hypothetical protein NT092_07495 [Bacteroidia bacterium]|nr:hypothetical protein [Bacteroidia bacterium]